MAFWHIKICNLIKVFGKGAVTVAESCKCFTPLLSFMSDLNCLVVSGAEGDAIFTVDFVPFFVGRSTLGQW